MIVMNPEYAMLNQRNAMATTSNPSTREPSQAKYPGNPHQCWRFVIFIDGTFFTLPSTSAISARP